MSTVPHRSPRRRVLTALTIASLAAMTLAGCASSSDDASGSDSLVPAADVGALKDSVPADFANGLTVATQADIAPLTFTNDDGQVVGFDQDLLGAISDVLGVPITVEPVTFENLILGLESGNYDFVGDTTIKKERLAKYDMVSYLTSSYSIATLKSAEALDDDETGICGVSVGIVSGELSADYITETIDPKCTAAGLAAVKTTEYKDFASTVLAVQSENVAAMMVDTMTFGYFQNSSDTGGDFTFNGPTRMAESNSGYSFLKSQNQELATVIQQALTKLVDNGVYAKLLAQYGLTESGIQGSPELNPAATI